MHNNCDNPKTVIVQVHVDNCVILGPDKQGIKVFEKYISEEYTIEDLGSICFNKLIQDRIGWVINQNREEKLICLLLFQLPVLALLKYIINPQTIFGHKSSSD